MTRLRGVGPRKAWLAGSSAPWYASTSTMRPARPSAVTTSLLSRRGATSSTSAPYHDRGSRLRRPIAAAHDRLARQHGGAPRTGTGRPAQPSTPAHRRRSQPSRPPAGAESAPPGRLPAPAPPHPAWSGGSPPPPAPAAPPPRHRGPGGPPPA